MTTVAGAAVELDLVEFPATALALAAAFAFFGGMLAVYGAYVRCIVECNKSRVAMNYLDVASREALQLRTPNRMWGGQEGAIGALWHVTIPFRNKQIAIDQDHVTSLHSTSHLSWD